MAQRWCIASSDLVEACAELVERQSELQRAVVKLNEGFSGEGNAPLDLSGLEGGNAAGLRQQLSGAWST